jgi:hypothetical protein
MGLLGATNDDLLFEPLLELLQYRHGFFLPVPMANIRRVFAFSALSLDPVELTDPVQGVFRTDLVVGQGLLELATGMRHAGQGYDVLLRARACRRLHIHRSAGCPLSS